MKNNVNKKYFLLYKLIMAIVVLSGGFLLLQWLSLDDYINLENFKKQREYLECIIQHHYALAVTVFMVLNTLVTALSIPLAIVLTIIGGYLFGIVGAVLYTNIATTLGSVIIFLVVRRFLGNFIQDRYRAQLAGFNKNIERYGVRYLLIIRFFSPFPFFIENVGAALTKISLGTFIWTTSLGIIPGSIVYAYIGKEFFTFISWHEVFSWQVALALLLVLLCGLVLIMKKKINLFDL